MATGHGQHQRESPDQSGPPPGLILSNKIYHVPVPTRAGKGYYSAGGDARVSFHVGGWET